MADQVLRFLTWNVHSCIGTDRRLDAGRVLSFIAELGPDIAALQEIDSRRGDHDGFDVLGECLGNDRAEARTICTMDGDYGHMLLSKYEIIARREHDVSVGRREARTVIEARIDAPGGPITVLAAHLGLSRRERRRQAESLQAVAATDRLPTVILGDFNEPTGFGAATRRLRKVFSSTGRHRTYPSRWPLFPLDRIWFEPAFELVAADVHRPAKEASDHLPLWADLRLKG